MSYQKGFEHYVAAGFGKNPYDANEVAHEHTQSFLDWMEREVLSKNPVPFAMMILGAGGGTGCGVSLTILDALRNELKIPTVVICVLPATVEGDLPFRNAWWWLQNVFKHRLCDGLITVDNDLLTTKAKTSRTLYNLFPDFNQVIAESLKDIMFGVLLEEKMHGDLYKVIDAKDFLTALNLGSVYGSYIGVTSVSRTTQETATLFSQEEININQLIEKAISRSSIRGVKGKIPMKALCILKTTKKIAEKIDHAELEEKICAGTQMKEIHYGVNITDTKSTSVILCYTYDRGDIARFQSLKDAFERYESRMRFILSG